MPAIYELHCDKTSDYASGAHTDRALFSDNRAMRQNIANVSNHPVSLITSMGGVLLYAVLTASAVVLTRYIISGMATDINKEPPQALDETHHGHYRSTYYGVVTGLVGGAVSGLLAGLTMRKLIKACNVGGLHVENKWHIVCYCTVAGSLLGGPCGGLYGSIIHQHAPVPPDNIIMYPTENILLHSKPAD